MKNHRSTLLKSIIAILLTAMLIPNQTVFAQKTTFDSRQIMFAVTGGKTNTFDYLRIVGPNQFNEMTSWEENFSPGAYVAQTKDYWWRDTIVITFSSADFGRKQCVIDYLEMPQTDSKFVTVTFDGKKCSGDSGSAGPVLKKEYDLLYALIFSDEDSLKLINEIDSAYKPLECATELAEGIAANGIAGKVVRVIKVTSTCGNMAFDKVNQILKAYNNKVEN